VHEHRRCTLDGLVYETPEGTRDPSRARAYSLGVLEIKCTRDRPWDLVPDAYAIQVQWQLGVTGKTHAWLAALHGGNSLRIYEFDFDETLFAHLAKIADRFWTDNVLAENPPPADGSEATSEALQAAYLGKAMDRVIPIDDVHLEAARTWLAAKQAVEDAEDFRNRCQNILRRKLQDENAFAFTDQDGEALITWTSQKGRRPFDLPGFRRDFPLLAEKFSGEQPDVPVMRATKALKALAGTTNEQAE
jgi:predicted phage-related endonuclease